MTAKHGYCPDCASSSLKVYFSKFRCRMCESVFETPLTVKYQKPSQPQKYGKSAGSGQIAGKVYRRGI